MTGRFGLEQNILSLGNHSYATGFCTSSELGEDVRYVRRDGFWIDPFVFKQIYRPNIYNDTFREAYEKAKERGDITTKNAIKNTMLSWEIGAGTVRTYEVRPDRITQTGETNLGIFTIPEVKYDYTNLESAGINVNFAAEAKIPIRFTDKKIKPEQRKLQTKTMSPEIYDGQRHLATIRGDLLDITNGEQSSSGIVHNREIDYNILMNTQITGNFANIYTHVEPNSFANARYIKERGVITQEYSTIGTKEASTNPLPDNVGYVQGKTKKYNHEETVIDRRAEYQSLLTKLKDLGIEDPDQFIKDYTALGDAVFPYGELAILNYIRDKNKNFDVETSTRELLALNISAPEIKTNITAPTSQNNESENTNNDLYINTDLNSYFKNSKNNKVTCDDEKFQGRMKQIGESPAQVFRDDIVTQYNTTTPTTDEQENQLFNEILAKIYPDLIQQVEDKRNQAKEKYGVDIYNLDLTPKEYEVLTRAYEIYEYTPEEIQQIRAGRTQLSNAIYNNYVRITKEIQNEADVKEWETKEKFDKFRVWVQNRFANFYNNQLNGTLYVDLKTGVDIDIMKCDGNIQPMGYTYGQVGFGYVNDHIDLSAGVRAQAGSYQIGKDEVSFPAINPYTQLKVDFFGMGDGGKPKSDFERFQRKNRWVGTLRYEPRTKTIMGGVEINLTPKYIKEK